MLLCVPDFHGMKKGNGEYFKCQNVVAGVGSHSWVLNNVLLSFKGLVYNGKILLKFYELQGIFTHF